MFFSGGKDSVACFLTLLEAGIPAHRIELHHHLVGGRGGPNIMDWPCTEAYCRRFAAAFGAPIYFSWKQGGFLGEFSRNESRTAPIIWESQDRSLRIKGGDRGGFSTRGKFPQLTSNLSVRWCSSYLRLMLVIVSSTMKIDSKLDERSCCLANAPRNRSHALAMPSMSRTDPTIGTERKYRVTLTNGAQYIR